MEAEPTWLALIRNDHGHTRPLDGDERQLATVGLRLLRRGDRTVSREVTRMFVTVGHVPASQTRSITGRS